MDFGNCENETDVKIIVLKENQSKMVFHNTKQKMIKVVKIDGCVEMKGNRCDFLVIDREGLEHYIELKGCDLKHGLSQLENTIMVVSNGPKLLEKMCFIICTRCPMLSPQIQNLKKRFKSLYNSKIIIKNRKFEYPI